MAQPPRFQKKKKAGAPGFVAQVKDAMQQIQRELEAAQRAGEEAAGHGRAAAKAAQEGVARTAESLKAEAERLRKEELKQRLKAQLKGRAKAPREAATEARDALGEAARRAKRAADVPAALSTRTEPEEPEAPLEGSSAEALQAPPPPAPISVDPAVDAEVAARQAADWHAGLRRMLGSRGAIQQAYVLHEILGPPKGSIR